MIATHTVLGLLVLILISLNSSEDIPWAYSSHLISSNSFDLLLTKMFLFLAIPPIYFNFLVSNSFKKDVLFPYAESIKTISGRYPRSRLRLTKSNARAGFFGNFGSFFPRGKDSAC